jgi:hypothetical protein
MQPAKNFINWEVVGLGNRFIYAKSQPHQTLDNHRIRSNHG